MKLPNLSYLMKVGQLRYIQSIYEIGEYRNPDNAVRNFLPPLERWICSVRGLVAISRLRSDRFYYYVLARTKYYDAVFIDAINSGVDCIINIGSGSDTRAFRFGDAIRQKGIRVLECDQPDAISTKQQIAKRKWSVDHVDYLPIDVNNDKWPQFETWLNQNVSISALVLMEGVSPYINEDSFGRLLNLLAVKLRPGSKVAYDFKLRGVAEDFGRSARTQKPFRLPESVVEVTAYHEARGYRVEHLELSTDLILRLLPDLARSRASLFCEDSLVQLSLAPKAGLVGLDSY